MPQSFPFKLSKANSKAPWNPYLDRGAKNDTASYITNPGVHFYRPWLATSSQFNGPAFIWPLGLESFDLTIEPQLGIHRFIGDNAVAVDVTHLGEERFLMSGNFPGLSGPDNLRALRQIVYEKTPKLGKILYVPHILAYAQRVVVARARFSHAMEDNSQDLTYEIEFVRIGLTKGAGKSDDVPQLEVPRAPGTGRAQPGARSLKVDSKHNTLRKIAAWKLGSAAKWQVIYDKNEKWFRKKGIVTAKVPDYHIPLGTRLYW